jgi:hypothetical protein
MISSMRASCIFRREQSVVSLMLHCGVPTIYKQEISASKYLFLHRISEKKQISAQ